MCNNKRKVNYVPIISHAVLLLQGLHRNINFFNNGGNAIFSLFREDAVMAHQEYRNYLAVLRSILTCLLNNGDLRMQLYQNYLNQGGLPTVDNQRYTEDHTQEPF